MFSEFRVRGPRLPPGKLNLATAIERVGELSVDGWIGKGASGYPEELSAEREAMALADEGNAAANYFEPPPEPAAKLEAACATCGKPATRVRAGSPYCSRHGKRLPIPRIAKIKATHIIENIDARGNTGGPGDDDQEKPAPDPAALFRWAKASAALRDKVFAGELRAALHEPGGKIVILSADQWRAEGFPAPDEACARLASRGHIPMQLIFDRADLETVFTAEKETEAGSTAARPAPRGPGRPGMGSLLAEEMERRARKGQLCNTMTAEAGYLAEWATSNRGDRKAPKLSTIRKELAPQYRELKSRPSNQSAGN